MERGFLSRSFGIKVAAMILGVTVGTTAVLGAIATGGLAYVAIAVPSVAIAGWGFNQMLHHEI